jgi:hypothetical protein
MSENLLDFFTYKKYIALNNISFFRFLVLSHFSSPPYRSVETTSFELYNQSNEEEITKNWRKDQITKKQELYSMNNNQIRNTDFIVPSSYILKTMKKKEEKQK